MKRTIILLGLLTVTQFMSGQEVLPRKEALKLAFFVSADLKVLQNTPIATDVDVKQPVALRDGDYGALVLPEAKLTTDAIAKAGEQVVPIGQLWLRRLTPVRDGDAISSSQLRVVQLDAGGESHAAVQCALGVKADGSGGLELLVFGKDKTPLVKVPLKKVESQESTPIGMSAEHADESGRIILKILGRYQATLVVTELEL